MPATARPARITAAAAHLQATLGPLCVPVVGRPATHGELLLAHTAEHVAALTACSRQAGADPAAVIRQASLWNYVFMNEHSVDAALYAAGGVLQATQAVMRGESSHRRCAANLLHSLLHSLRSVVHLLQTGSHATHRRARLRGVRGPAAGPPLGVRLCDGLRAGQQVITYGCLVVSCRLTAPLDHPLPCALVMWTPPPPHCHVVIVLFDRCPLASFRSHRNRSALSHPSLFLAAWRSQQPGRSVRRAADWTAS